MASESTAFSQLPADDTRALAVRPLQVALQAELLRAGALWEESLAILREAASHGRPLGTAAEALAWYRTTYHPDV